MVYQSYNPTNGKWTLKALKNYIQQKSLTNYKAIALIWKFFSMLHNLQQVTKAKYFK